MVIHHQHIQLPNGGCNGGFLRHGFGARFEGLDGELDVDLRTDIGLAVQVQSSAHHLAQAAANHQAQPGTAERQLPAVFCLGKGFKQAGLIEGADANPGIDDV